MIRIAVILLACLQIQACSSEKKAHGFVGLSEADSRQVLAPKGAATKYLAYQHNVVVDVDFKSIATLHAKLIERCNNDTEHQCVVLRSNLQLKTYARSDIRLKLLPSGVAAYLTVLGDSGNIVSQSSEAEDLTDAIVDNQKRLDMLQKHRTRLEQLEAREDVDIDALLKIATEISRVQSELEFALGKEQKLASRVENDILNIQLSSSQSVSALGVIGLSLKSFSDDMAYAVADVIYFIASIIPWLPLFVLFAWLMRWCWRFFRRKSV